MSKGRAVQGGRGERLSGRHTQSDGDGDQPFLQPLNQEPSRTMEVALACALVLLHTCLLPGRPSLGNIGVLNRVILLGTLPVLRRVWQPPCLPAPGTSNTPSPSRDNRKNISGHGQMSLRGAHWHLVANHCPVLHDTFRSVPSMSHLIRTRLRNNNHSESSDLRPQDKAAP